jgi:putative protease
MGPNAVEPNASAATAPEISAARTDFDVADYLDELRNAATRPLCTGFFLPDGRRAVLDAAAPEERRPVVARVLERVPERLADHTDAGTWRVAVRAPWSPADAARVLVPRGRYADLAPGGYALLAEPRPDGAPPDAPAPAPIPMDRAHPGTTALLRCTDAKAAAHLAPGVFLRRA